jgi:predicted membrane protein
MAPGVAVSTLVGALLIVAAVIVVALGIALVYAVIASETKRERTSRGTHRAGPGRS